MKVPQAPLVLQALLVSEVLRAQLAPLAYQDDLVHRDLQDLQVKREPQVRRVLKDQQVVMASRDLWDSRVQQVLLAPPARMETRARSGSLARRAARVTKGSRVHQVLQAHKVRSVSQVQLVLMESQVLEGSKASLVRKVMKDLEVFPVPLALWACRACLDLQVRREKQVMLGKWVHQVHLGPEAPPVHQEQMDPKALLGE